MKELTDGEKRHDGYPTVSVLMPVFNECQRLLELSINSILEQTLVDFEFIILDDGSDNEETIITLERFAKQDPRIRLYRKPHRGLTRTLNIGLSLCRGEFICRQDSDDWSEADRIKMQVEFLMNNPGTGIVGGNVAMYQEKGYPLWIREYPLAPKEILSAFKRNNPFCHGAVCFRRDIAEAVGGYREELVCSQDYDFFWRICERSAGANISRILYHYRFRRQSITAQKYSEKARTNAIISILAEMRYRGAAEDFQHAVKQAETMGLSRSENLAYHADQLMVAGYYWQALRAYAYAAALSPFRLRVYLKLLRLALFVFLPQVRCRLFRSDIWRIRAAEPGLGVKLDG